MIYPVIFVVNDLGLTLAPKMCPDKSQAFKEISNSQAFTVEEIKKSNGQNRIHPEARWPKPGTPFHASPRAPSYWPTPAHAEFETGPPDSGYSSPHRLPDFNHTYPIMAGYSTTSPHAHASSRHRGTRQVIFAVDAVVRAAEL